MCWENACTLSPQMTFWFRPCFTRKSVFRVWFSSFFFCVTISFLFFRISEKKLEKSNYNFGTKIQYLQDSPPLLLSASTTERGRGWKTISVDASLFPQILFIISKTSKEERENFVTKRGKSRLREISKTMFSYFHFSLKISCESQKFPFIFSKIFEKKIFLAEMFRFLNSSIDKSKKFTKK